MSMALGYKPHQQTVQGFTNTEEIWFQFPFQQINNTHMEKLNEIFPGAWYSSKKKKLILRSQSYPCLKQCFVLHV